MHKYKKIKIQVSCNVKMAAIADVAKTQLRLNELHI